jgi:glycosyltransferase involved in cell wall biosynthesis
MKLLTTQVKKSLSKYHKLKPRNCMIAFSHYGTPTDISGVTSWLQGVLRFLHDKGDNVSLCIHHFGQNPSEGTLYKDFVDSGIAINAVSIPATTREGVRHIMRFLNQTKPSIFLPQCLPSSHFAANIASKSGLPWIFTIHSDDPVYWALGDAVGPSKGKGVWVAVSQNIAEEAQNAYPHADIRCIPYGVEIPQEKARWSDERFRIVYSGRILEEQKRISKVLDVFIAACQQSDKIEAVFIGDGPERKTIESRIQDEGMNSRIRITGRLEALEVRRELLAAQAFVLMSDYEGLPVSLLEAMACGVVPVVRDIRSGIPEVVQQGSTGLVVSDDTDIAARALLNLASSKKEWHEMSNSARFLINSKYNQANCLASWCSLIHEVMLKSTVRYPIKIPFLPHLPPLDDRLSAIDWRRLPLHTRVKNKISNIRRSIKTL